MKILSPEEITGSGLTFTLGNLANSISKQDCDTLAKMGEWVAVENEIIVNDGSSQKYLYMVLDGKVSVFKTTHESNKKILINLEVGRCFGEMAFLSGGEASANVEALGRAVLWRINHTHLLEYASANSAGGQLSLNLAVVLSERLNHVNQMMMELARTSEQVGGARPQPTTPPPSTKGHDKSTHHSKQGKSAQLPPRRPVALIYTLLLMMLAGSIAINFYLVAKLIG